MPSVRHSDRLGVKTEPFLTKSTDIAQDVVIILAIEALLQARIRLFPYMIGLQALDVTLVGTQ